MMSIKPTGPSFTHGKLPAAWLCGGVFMVSCDTLARTVISPTELPVGVVTGLLGGIIFVYVLCRRTEGKTRCSI